MPAAKKSAKRTAATAESEEAVRFTDAERAALKERAKELKKAAKRGSRAQDTGENDVLAAISEMADSDRAMAERIHALVKENAPELAPRTWYGMPAYAKDGKVVCFFTPATKFKTRYATFGFEERANLDEGTMWPTAFALTDLTAANETKLAKLVKKAAS
jgi:uncharacterized protein YdhG (YjbR/CyaY superfamily)